MHPKTFIKGHAACGWDERTYSAHQAPFTSGGSKKLPHTKLLIQQGSHRKHPKAAQQQPVMTGQV